MKKLAIIIWGLISITSLYGVDLSSRNMTLRLNGHDHLVFDALSYKIEKAYLRNKSSIEDTIETVFRTEAGIDTCTAILPENVTTVTFDEGSASDTGVIKIKIEDCHLYYEKDICNFDMDFDLLITGNIFISTDSLSYILNVNNLVSICNHMNINLIPPESCEDYQGQWWNPFKWVDLWTCMGEMALCAPLGMASQLMISFGFMNQFVEEIPDTSILIYCLPTKSEVDNYDPSIANDILNSFPINFSFTYDGVDSNLVISMDFMKGTDANPTAFTGIQPDPVTHDSYDHIGYGTGFDNFMYAYQSSSWADPNVDNPIECASTLLNLMSNTSIQSIRVEVPWLYIQGNIPTNRVNCGLNPDFLDTPTGQDSIEAFMNRSTWQDFDAVLSMILDNKIEPILQIGHGHTRHAPRIGTGKLMAPNNPTGQNDSTYFVDENTYLYYLKLFAHATVRKYRNKIAFWQIEGEFNVAKFNRLFYGWRLGNLWDDESSGGFQDKVWDILVNAVRTEDPSAKIVTNFHMLNLVKALQRFGPDCDIIGLNIYPNLKFAYPVLGFVPGELVWATRRALKGLNMSDKDVWITETNYPALYSSDPPANISLDSNFVYYSYGRQADFLESALETSLNYGAKGFFWWTLWLYETATNEDFGDLSDYGGLIPKNTMNLKQPTASRFSTTTLNNHPGKCNVQLTNKNISTGVNLGGKISLASERDSLNSGETAYALRDRTHISRTDQRVLQGLVHNRWNSESDYKLAVSFPVLSTWTEYDRIAYFTSTDNITISTNLPQASIEFWDPWYYNEQTMTQPDCFRTISPGNFSVFRNQNQNFESGKPIYHLKAPKVFSTTSTIYDFVRWESPDPSVAVFNGSSAISTINRETQVVFKSSGATVTAVYRAVNQLANYTLSIPPDEILTITAGANISFAEGFTFNVKGALTVAGTIEDPVTLSSTGMDDDFASGGYGYLITYSPQDTLIRVSSPGAHVTIANTVIENAYCGVFVNGDDQTVELDNVEIANTNIGILLNSNTNNTIIVSNSYLHDNDIAIALPDSFPACEQTTYFLLHNNVFANNNMRGIYIAPQTMISYSWWSRLYFYVVNCTFYGNASSAIYFGHPIVASGNGHSEMYLYNNIFSNGSDVIRNGNPTYWELFDELDNVFYASGTNFTLDETSGTYDPLMITHSGGDFRLRNDSPCIDEGFNEVYLSLGDEEDEYVLETDPDGTVPDIGAYYFPQYSISGTISSDTTWYGKVTVTGNVTISSGATLTIDPGTLVAFNSGKKITVNGAIDVNGLSSAPAIFTRSDTTSHSKTYWYGIYIPSGGSYNFDHFEMYGANYGIYS